MRSFVTTSTSFSCSCSSYSAPNAGDEVSLNLREASLERKRYREDWTIMEFTGVVLTVQCSSSQKEREADSHERIPERTPIPCLRWCATNHQMPGASVNEMHRVVVLYAPECASGAACSHDVRREGVLSRRQRSSLCGRFHYCCM